MVNCNDSARLDFHCLNLMQDQFSTVMVPENKHKSFTHSHFHCSFPHNKLEISECWFIVVLLTIVSHKVLEQWSCV